MNKVARTWLQNLESKALLYDPDETRAYTLHESIEAHEQDALHLMKDLIDTRIPDGIESCIARGSDRLALDVPIHFIASEAFRALKSWAVSEGLVLSVAHLTVDDENRTVLCLNPER